MTDDGDDTHRAAVDAWLQRTEGLSAEAVLDLFESGMQRTLRRAQPTLGEVTLGAIVGRVLYTATERYPFLSHLHLSGGAVAFDALRNALGNVDREELRESARFMLVEFLTVLGKLTAEILTPALHAELTLPPEAANSETRMRKTKA